MLRMLSALSATLLLCQPAWAAADYPSRPISIIVGWAPGGTTDTLARLVATNLGEKLNQTVVVENASGAGGLIGMQKLKSAAPDGYTLVFNNMSLAILPQLHPTANYDPLKEVEPVGVVANVPMVLAVSNKSGVQDLPGLLQRMRTGKEKINMGSGGPGSTAHLAEAMFLHLSKTQAELIQYRGTGPALTDLMSGMIDGVIDQTVTILPLHKDGRIKAIAVTGDKRVAQAPDIPTFAENGLPQFNLTIWNGLVAPKGTPAPVIAKLEQALNEVIDSAAFKTRLDQLAAQAPTAQERGGRAMRAVLERDMANVAALAKEADLMGGAK